MELAIKWSSGIVAAGEEKNNNNIDNNGAGRRKFPGGGRLERSEAGQCRQQVQWRRPGSPLHGYK